jgi:aminoglycoside phosphotransferase (APT) family kinase protein
VIGEFFLSGAPGRCHRLEGGHINATWRLDAGGHARYTLQRLNSRVFPDGEAVMRNILRVTDRIRERAGADRTLRLMPTHAGSWWHVGPDGAVWRMYEFIGGVAIHHEAASPALAESAARAFGEFTRMTSDPPLELEVTLPGFHDTPRRLAGLRAAIDRDVERRARSVVGESERILGHQSLAERIAALLASGELPTWVAHNDAKISNVLFDERTGAPRCVIDLDTVMPGSPLHDFGDLVRSMVSGAAEDAGEPGAAEVRLDLFERIAAGYLAGTAGLLSALERAHLVEGALAIVLEQAARFLTDHLEGDTYYGVSSPGQNLRRAQTQLAIFESLVRQVERLDGIVERIR